MLRLDLPRADRASRRAARDRAGIAGSDAVSPSGEPAPEPEPDRDVWPWLLGGGVGLVVIVVLLACCVRAEDPRVPRLRRTTPDEPGWTRRRAGAGFVYLDEHGDRLSARTPSGARTW